jgi:hypothetical protein
MMVSRQSKILSAIDADPGLICLAIGQKKTVLKSAISLMGKGMDLETSSDWTPTRETVGSIHKTHTIEQNDNPQGASKDTQDRQQGQVSGP